MSLKCLLFRRVRPYIPRGFLGTGWFVRTTGCLEDRKATSSYEPFLRDISSLFSLRRDRQFERFLPKDTAPTTREGRIDPPPSSPSSHNTPRGQKTCVQQKTNLLQTMRLSFLLALSCFLYSSNKSLECHAFQFMKGWKMPTYDPHEEAVKEKFGDKSKLYVEAKDP